ncbi:hypothetical protein DL768_011256 [Monosporascus sp. mg162]|nr:hypothetical protein DL768_011256 [Monosporascus sp. mg162]
MCLQNNKILQCTLCGEQIGFKEPTTQFRCHEARDLHFGACGQVREGRPAVFHVICAGCPGQRWAARQKAGERPWYYLKEDKKKE